MSRALIFVVIMLPLFSLYSQNLILNSSFERFKKCPKDFTINILKLKKGVVSTKGTPDYFHNCSSSFDTKSNPYGNQLPADGDAFCGLILTSDSKNECTDREYIQMKLIEPLEKGKKYLFTIKVSLADTSGYYTDQVGVHFYSKSFSKKQILRSLYGKASINNLSGAYMKDSKKWMIIKGLYNAKGGEKYLMVGNFQHCRQTSRKAVTPNGLADSLKKYEDGDPNRGYEASPTVLENMKRKFREDISGSTLKAYNLAYYYIDDLSLTEYHLNDSLSFLTQETSCTENGEEDDIENLVQDGSFSFNKDNLNPYWETASKGTPDFTDNKVGLYLYSDLGKNNREYIITKLKKRLTPCKKYHFRVSIRRNSSYKFAVDQFQLAAIDSNYFAEDRMIFPFDSDYSTPKNFIIENTGKWIELCGEFTPKSCSNYIVLGNFSDDDETYIYPLEGSTKDGPYAYYFIDNVSLKEIDSISDCEVSCTEKVKESLVVIENNPSSFNDTLFFYFESSSTYTSSTINRAVFSDLINAFIQDSTLQIIIEGHADNSGNEKTNQELSKARAEGIYKYLRQFNIPKDRLVLKYFGSQKSRTSNATKALRAKNRRVEAYLIKNLSK